MGVAPELWQEFAVRPGSRLRLLEVSAEATKHVADKKSAHALLKEYRQEIDGLLRVLAEENERSVLLVLQGMDASGKDSTIRRVFTGVNPQNCRVVSFKEPTREDLEHNYLWRVWRATPRRGELRIFNRSQYEDVLVPRAHGSLTAREMETRLREISDLERFWTENRVVIRKCFLHISRKEQTERFQSRLETTSKHWKVKESDFRDLRLWSKFQATYETILSSTSTAAAPWYIVPADRKWYRDVAIAGIILSTLRSMNPKTPKPNIDRKKFRL